MPQESSERHVRVDRASPLDDDRERRGGVLLLGKGAVLAHRLARPLAAELDDDQQSDAGPGAIATSDCGSWRGMVRAIACASMR
jgi:hypothetical protein